VATSIDRQIAQELAVREEQVAAAVALLDNGATVPFIARYGALDDAQLRTLDERLRYLRELEERRTVILNSIREQGKLDDALEAAIRAADSKGRLEDIYLPFKPKRRTKAEIAREAGLEPLADLLLARPEHDPMVAAAAFVDTDKQVADVVAALDGARSILVERFAEDADLIGSLRVTLARRRGRGLRERCRRRCQHCVGAPFGARFGHRRRLGAKHRPTPQRKWSVPLPQGAQGGATSRAEGVRTVRWLSAHSRR
jgi:transcriptional accessory protein Tex/SPT6